MKKLLSIILVIVMLCSTFAGLQITSHALDSSGSCGDNLTYTYTKTNGIGVLTINGTGEMYNYEYLDGWAVSPSPFAKGSAINYIIIKSGVTSIGRDAFYKCSGLRSITIPDSVTSIGYNAFYGCTGLTSITIPDSVTYFGGLGGCTALKELTMPVSAQICNDNYAFKDCTNIEKITLTKGTGIMQNYGYSTSFEASDTCYQYTPWYNSCAKLKELVIEDGVSSIGNYAFYDLSSLTNINIPNSVTSIGKYAFYGCIGLTKVNISSIESWCNIAFGGNYSNPLNYAHDLFLNGELVTDLVITNSVTAIKSYAFDNCDSLTSITIPDSVTSIGSAAFYGCSSLTKVNISSIESWCNIAFYDNPLNYAHDLFLNGELVTDLVIPNSVTTINNYSFPSCSGLTSITIPDSVTSIGSTAFYGCSGLTNINISDSVTSIGKRAFEACSGLTSVTIPDSVTSIGDYAFYGCTGLTSAVIGNSVTSVGNYAFYGCAGLTSTTIGNSVASIGEYAFYNCSELKELTMPCSAKIYNSEYTFSNCTNIEKVTLTKGTGTMQNYASSSSASNTYYQYTPWYISRNNLKELVIENGVKNVGSYAFYKSSSLTSITIPNSVTSIGEYAFYDCRGLTSATIGNSVTSIGDMAFNYCPNFETVYLYSKDINSTQNLIASMPANSTLYAYSSTDAEIYCSIYGVNFVPIEGKECELGHHDYDTSIVEPTCTENGKTVYRCKNCDYSYFDTIPKLGHTPAEVARENEKPATCIQAGSYDEVVYCSVCEAEISRETKTIPATGSHTPAEAVRENEVSATCTHTGAYEEVIYCSVCGEELSREPKQIELLPHNYSSVVTSPTCTHAGYTTYTCEECGYSYIGDFTHRADHNYKDTVVEPTTESQGYTVHTCTVCGYSYVDSITDILPSEMHYIIPSLEEINATLTIKSNENEYSVNSANGVFELDNIKGDVYRVYASQKNSLTVCIGEYDTKNGEFVNNDVVIPVGNVNGDDVIDLSDVSLLLAGNNYGKQNADLDLTGDNQITVEDISIVLQSQNFGAQSVPIV